MVQKPAEEKTERTANLTSGTFKNQGLSSENNPPYSLFSFKEPENKEEAREEKKK